MMSRLYFNEENDYSEENTFDNEVFCSTILQLFQLEPEQKICVLMRAMRKKLNIFKLQLVIFYILGQGIFISAIAYIAKMKLEKQIVFIADKWMQCVLLQLKSQSLREASCHPAFMGICRAISHTCQPYLLDEFFFLFLVQLNEIRRLWESKVLSFCFWC